MGWERSILLFWYHLKHGSLKFLWNSAYIFFSLFLTVLSKKSVSSPKSWRFAPIFSYFFQLFWRNIQKWNCWIISHDSLPFNTLRNCHAFFCSSCTVLGSCQQFPRVPGYLCCHQHLLLFLIVAIIGTVRWYTTMWLCGLHWPWI